MKELFETVRIIVFILRDNRGSTEIPDDVLKEIARALLPGIIAYFESDEGKAEFEEWKAEQERAKATPPKGEKSEEKSSL